MSKKARGDISILKIPLDCFSHILLFYDDPKDFLSLVLTIKRLLDHTRKIVPSCTKNIPFRIYSIPKSFQEHVTFLVCSNEFSNGRLVMPYYYLLSMFESTIDSFFNRLPEKFSNLNKLKIVLRRKKARSGESVDQRMMREIILEDKQHLLYLTDLSLTFSGCSLTILRSFPKLRRLELRNYFTQLVEESATLNIDWKSLVSLREVVLSGWTFEDPSSLDQATKNRLEKLHLYKTTEHEFTDFRSFDSLQDLSIKGTSLLNVMKIENAVNLRNLHIFLPVWLERNHDNVAQLSFLNLPSLESFRIEGPEKGPEDLDLDDAPAVKIEGFPKLRELYLNDLSLSVVIKGIPDLQTLRAFSCFKVDFRNESDIPKGLLKLKVFLTGLGSVFLRHLQSRKLPKLQKVLFSPEKNRDFYQGNFKIGDFKFACLPDLHSLEMYPTDPPADQQIFTNYHLEADEYPQLKYLMMIRVNGCLVFNGEERSRLESLHVRKGGYLTLRNHPMLHYVSFHGFFTQPVVIENCPQLKTLKLEVRETQYQTEDGCVLHLRNLPKCETLEIEGFQKFAETDGLRIKNCPIRTLSLTLKWTSYRLLESRRGAVRENKFHRRLDAIDITKKNFPVLELLQVDTGESYSTTQQHSRTALQSFRIRKISGIDTLKMIEIAGSGYQNYPFVKTIQGIDLEKVQVKAPQENPKSLKLFIARRKSKSKDWASKEGFEVVY